ncbi:MAG: bifunctional 4-hydroxy-3-methylbut-2-enyl diphosphate reductase/30S ribosomal protein S1 [Clostridia bacterium]|nr:bifunctional 4-hydroxy-3-methylbut-2-enyl diphosphate reductase/30S ribosomal protein S1 [Clostridia bacterium]
MKFIIAKSAGFCFGVKKAVETVENNMGVYPKLYTLGEIIHNPQVVQQFKDNGVYPVESADEVSEGAVIIRSHGAPKAEIDAFSQKGIRIVDATCPFVRRIQKIVQKALLNNEFIVIIGERTHPEVIGINGHCENTGFVVDTWQEVQNLPETEKELCVVAQTTTRRDVFDSIIALLKEKYETNKINVFDTICDATGDRQSEAKEIAQKADVMVVIGGRQSSNTAKLYKICSEYCKRTYAVENTKEVLTIKTYKNDIIGVTAGASTPDWLIKEVVEKMSENEVFAQDLSFEEEMNKTLVKIRPGQIITGKVIYAKKDEVSVDIGYKADGLIAKEELGEEDPTVAFAEGDEIEVEVIKINDGNGNVVLSRKKVLARAEADKTIANISNGEIFEVTVKEAVKGGLTADYEGVRVFIPRSQIRANGFAKDVDRYVGQTLRVKAIDIDAKRRRVVATHGAIVAQERAEALENAWSKLAEGETVKGIVRRLTDFGAFVDLGGVDGLVHIGDIAWYRINKPEDVLKVNDEIEVVILSLDRENQRISLGYKQLQPKPWDNAEEKYAVDSVVKGTVVRITTFGAFVALEPGIDGLVHISEVSNKFVSKVEEAVKVGDEIEALVLDVNTEQKRISLSIKALLPEEVEETEEAAKEAAEAVEEAAEAVEEAAEAEE